MARQLQLQSAMNVSFNPAKLSTESAKGQTHGADSFLALLNLADPEAALLSSATPATAVNSSAAAKSLLPTETQFMAGATGKRRGQAKDSKNADQGSAANLAMPNAPAAQSAPFRMPLPAQGELAQPNVPAPADANEQPQMLSYFAMGTTNPEDPTAAIAQKSNTSWKEFGASVESTPQSSRSASQAKWNASTFATQIQGGGISKQFAKEIPQADTKNAPQMVTENTRQVVAENTQQAVPWETADGEQKSGGAVKMSQALGGQVADNAKEQPMPDVASRAKEQAPLSIEANANGAQTPWLPQPDIATSNQSTNGTSGNTQASSNENPPASSNGNTQANLSGNAQANPSENTQAKPAENLLQVTKGSARSEAAKVQTPPLPVIAASEPALVVKPIPHNRAEQTNSDSHASETQPESPQASRGEKPTSRGETYAAGNGHAVAHDQAATDTAQAASQASATAAQNAQFRAAWNAANQNYTELFKDPKLSVPASVSPTAPAQGTGNNGVTEKNSSSQQKNANEFVSATTGQSVSGEAASAKQPGAVAKTDDSSTQNSTLQIGPVMAGANGSANTVSNGGKDNAPAAGTSVAPDVKDEPISQRPEVIAAMPMGSVQTARLVQKLSETEWRVGIQAGEFGKVDIHTSINQSQISARIYVEHDELEKVLAGGLPQLHEKLTVEHRMDAQVELYNSGSSYSSGADRQQHQQQQRTREQNFYASQEANNPAPMSSTVPEPSGAVTATGVDMHV